MKQYISIGVIVLVGVVALWYFLWPDATSRRISELEERPKGREVHIVAFGDSLTEGYGLADPEIESYPAQLEQALQAKGLSVRVTNAGVSGETSAENAERAGEVIALQPDVVLLGIGGNDALRSLPVATTQANIEATIATLQNSANPPVVILLQMQSPLNAGLEYKRAFDGMYPTIADEQELILLPFATAEVYLKPEFRQADIIHLNAAGYATVIELYLEEPLAKVVEKLGG